MINTSSTAPANAFSLFALAFGVSSHAPAGTISTLLCDQLQPLFEAAEASRHDAWTQAVHRVALEFARLADQHGFVLPNLDQAADVPLWPSFTAFVISILNNSASTGPQSVGDAIDLWVASKWKSVAERSRRGSAVRQLIDVVGLTLDQPADALASIPGNADDLFQVFAQAHPLASRGEETRRKTVGAFLDHVRAMHIDAAGQNAGHDAATGARPTTSDEGDQAA